MTDRRVVVTGAASGFGREIATAFAARGARVAVVDQDATRAREVASALTGSVALVADVTHPDELDAMMDAAATAFGGLDVVVSNAGAGHPARPMVELDEAVFDLQYALNLRAAYLGALAASRWMTRGVIVNVASMGGRRPRPLSTLYNSAKGGLIAMTAAMARSLPEGIRIYAVNPTGAETPFLARTLGPDGLTPEARAAVVAGIPMGRLATTDDVAAAVLHLASSDCTVRSGSFLDVDGGRSIQ